MAYYRLCLGIGLIAPSAVVLLEQPHLISAANYRFRLARRLRGAWANRLEALSLV